MRTSSALLVALCFVSGQPVFADEVFVIQVFSDGIAAPFSPDRPPGRMRWESDLILYNRGDSAAEVRLLGISNGQMPPEPRSFFLPPRKATTLFQARVLWYPRSTPPQALDLWVMHLEIPSEVSLESSMLFGIHQDFGPAPPQTFVFGRTSLPVYRSLAPPNTPQVHLGADLGGIPSRINVGIYNASPTATATAKIELRSACDDTLLQSRIVSVPPNTIHQFGGFGARVFCDGRFGSARGSNFAMYVVVTVDQPSLSYIAALRNDELPEIGTVIVP